jgi:CheY-like chemotaxis protein
MKTNRNRRQILQILLIEDNRDDEELTLMTLAQNNIAHDINVVRDGAEALDYLFGTGGYADQKPPLPQLILLDVKLPKVDGIEVLKRVKSEARTQLIPVVMLTSSREKLDVERCYRFGANSYVVKPVDFVQFKDAIRQLGTYWQALNVLP